MAETVIMKSYDRKNDPIFEYIEKHSLRLVNLDFNPFTVNLKKNYFFKIDIVVYIPLKVI